MIIPGRNSFIRSCLLFVASGFFYLCCHSQNMLQPDSQYTVVVAGKQYATSDQQQKKWGAHYRKEWNTPVRVKLAMLDTLAGGLTPYEAGGSRQTKSLRLKDTRGKEYVLRSIDKTFGGALPDIVKGTFIEDIANDQASISHPYAAVTIPPMIEAAGIYHTNPQVYFIPKQEKLGEYNAEYGDKLYLFEQRPDENWEEAANFGNSKKIIGTEKLLEKILEDNEKKVNQLSFVRARLFDFLVGDLGRHEDQWRWAEIETGKKIIYEPIPRDRDQVYARLDGSMVSFIFSAAGLRHLQTFDSTIHDVNASGFPSRNLDRLMTNEVSHEQWIAIAKDLQQKITDTIISSAIRQMPPEVFPISGNDIISKLKSRRKHLAEYADTYYRFLSLNIDIPGTSEREYFEVKRKDDDHTLVTIYNLKKDGHKNEQPIYRRTFITKETNEIRLYGMGGDDIFEINGNTNKGILIRIIPGAGIDSVIDHSGVAGKKKMTRIYDDEKSGFNTSPETHIKISTDTVLNNYSYKNFEYDKKGIVIRPGLTLGAGYHIEKQAWRKFPFGTEHRLMAYYGPNRGSVALEYRYIANQLIGKWDLEAITRADIPFVANYYGTGNESVMNTDVNRKYYRFRSTIYTAGININRTYDLLHHFNFNTALQAINLINEEDRFIAKDVSGTPLSSFDQKYFVTAGAGYQFKKSDDPVAPSKGFEFNLAGAYTQNVQDLTKAFATYASSISFYLPFFKNLSLAMRAGGSTVTGKPEFYQLTTLSGKENMRGFRRQRYYGKTSFYNNNELRLILNTSNHLFNGKIGVLAFVDQGRVWQPGEISDTWHVGYGGGFFVAPFNRILLNASYGISKDDRVIHFRIGFFF